MILASSLRRRFRFSGRGFRRACFGWLALIRLRCRLILLLVFVLLFIILGMQLIVRRERRTVVLLQRDLEDLVSLVKERFGLHAAPRRSDQRFKMALGDEVQPLAVGTPRGIGAVITIGGD